MFVKNLTSPRGAVVANQFVIRDGNKVCFQSYESTIAIVDYDNKEITIYPDYNYSRTTSKYRNIFFEEYFWELASLKALEKAINSGICDGFTVVLAE